ncbi:MAG: hypothetical protein R2719_05070 [Micropruina sp.]
MTQDGRTDLAGCTDADEGSVVSHRCAWCTRGDPGGHLDGAAQFDRALCGEVGDPDALRVASSVCARTSISS